MAPSIPMKAMTAVIKPDIRIRTDPEAILEPVNTVRSFWVASKYMASPTSDSPINCRGREGGGGERKGVREEWKREEGGVL